MSAKLQFDVPIIMGWGVFEVLASRLDIGDPATLENGASIDEAKAAYEELKREV